MGTYGVVGDIIRFKFYANLQTRFPEKRCRDIMDLCMDRPRLEHTPVNEFMDLFVIN